MADDKPKKKRAQQTYKYKQNAVSLTIYDMHGETIPAGVRHEAEQAIMDIALRNQLLLNVALT